MLADGGKSPSHDLSSVGKNKSRIPGESFMSVAFTIDTRKTIASITLEDEVLKGFAAFFAWSGSVAEFRPLLMMTPAHPPQSDHLTLLPRVGVSMSILGER